MSAYAGTERDVASAAAGDREAFVRLVEAYANMVTSIALAIVRDLHASQDIAQEVFLVAWRDVRKLRNPSSFLPWVRQITRNRANEWLREKKQINLYERDADAILAAVVDPRPNAVEALQEEEQQQIVSEVIESLPDEAREVITLFYKEGRSIRQVSELLGLSEDAVKKRLSRARERIREELLDHFGDAVRKSASAAAIATIVGASLTVAGPSAAAATTTTLGKVVGGSLGAKLLAAFGGSFLGASLGAAGVVFGVRKNIAQAIDAEERAELGQFGRVAVGVVVLASIGFGVAGVMESASVLIVTHLLFVSAMTWLYMSRLPRIIARRVAMEIANDPSAAARYRKGKSRGYIGLLTGMIISTATVVWGVMTLL